MLRGRLSGYAVGLVQLLRDVPCPDIMARRLLLAVLVDFRETAQHYEMHLSLGRQMLEMNGTSEELAAIDQAIEQHKTRREIPKRWQLDQLFSLATFDACGVAVLNIWTIVLIRLCVLESYWESILLGAEPSSPYLLPGVHPDAEVFSTKWLADFEPAWAEEIEVVPSASSTTH